MVSKTGIGLGGLITGIIIGAVISGFIYFLFFRNVPEIKIESCPVCTKPTVTPVEKLCPECPKCKMCPVCPMPPISLERPPSPLRL